MDEKVNDGGPAFPTTNPNTNYNEEGMSLRDWFAGMSMNSMSGPGWPSREDTTEIAKRAYQVADAMIERRGK